MVPKAITPMEKNTYGMYTKKEYKEECDWVFSPLSRKETGTDSWHVASVVFNASVTSMSAVNVLPDFGMQILFAVTLAAAGAAYARRCQKRI